MSRFLLISFLFLLVMLQAEAQETGIPRVELNTIDGKKVEFNDPEKLSVVVFLSPSCPLSQKYTLTLNELAKEFRNEVKFYGVFAEADPVPGEYQDFKVKYDMQFALCVDKEKQLVKALAASVTPECFVISKGKIFYHGAIDDWAIELGKTRKKATVSFLKNAIQSVRSNTAAVPNYVKPTGCFID